MLFRRKNKNQDYLLKSFGKPKKDTFQFDRIDCYYRGKDHADSFQVISDKTCNDLDFEELFMFLDRTHSKVGQQYLYSKLRIISKEAATQKKQEELIELMLQDSNLRVSIQGQLEKLNSNNAYYLSSLFQEEHIKPPKWFFIIPLLSFTAVFSLLLLPFNSNLIYVLASTILINLGLHYWNKRNLYRYTGAITQLIRLNRLARELFKFDQFKRIAPKLESSMKLIDRVKNRMLLFKLEGHLEGDFAVVFWTFLELLKSVFLLEPVLFFSVMKHLDAQRTEIEEVFAFVGEVDTIISIASLRKGLDKYSIPEIEENKISIVANEAYHPLIPECVSNSIVVDGKSVLLTGSNMSGKTSFIRSIGINALTALTINTCFADSFSLPRLKIFSAVRISDDLLNDKSYYLEEVLTIKEMITESENGEPNLFLLDEIFKGTNTVERIAAGKSVLSALSRGNNIVFVSTHDVELADLLRDEYELFHFCECVTQNRIDFDYKLKQGKLTNRNAIRILQINDYPEHVIEEAMKLSRELDEQKFLELNRT